MFAFTIFIQHCKEVLAYVISQDKETKSIKIGKKSQMFLIYTWHDYIHRQS